LSPPHPLPIYPETRAHLRDEIVRRRGIDDLLCGNVDRAALIGIFARALARDHDVHAMIAQNPLKLDNIGEPWDLLEDQGLIGEQARDHQRKRSILRARNRDCAAQTLTADYAYSIHACPRVSPWRFTCILSDQGPHHLPRGPGPTPSVANCGESPTVSCREPIQFWNSKALAMFSIPP